MKNRKITWKNPFAVIGITAAVFVAVYVLGAYPFYTWTKVLMLKGAYREIAEMPLTQLDEDEEETLQEIGLNNIELLITDEEFNLLYSSERYKDSDWVDKVIKGKLDQYKTEPTAFIRKNSTYRVIRIRGLSEQNGQKVYIYMRYEVRLAGEVIRYTTLYFFAALCLLWAVCIFFRTKSSAWRKQAEKDMQEGVRLVDEQLREAQKEYVANISHELKTPLAVISSQVEMLQSMWENVDREYYFSSIREEIDRMSELVGDLLDLTIIDHHMEEMETEKLNLTDMMEYMVLKYNALFCKNKIKLTTQIEKDCIVVGNRMYLEEAVNNYIMNAFQHTGQGKKIEISLEKSNGYARIEVYNEGSHVAGEDMEDIWRSYYMKPQGRRREQRMSNAGLGLYRVRKIVEQHKGQCGVSNEENGVRFWIRLPVKYN